MRTLRTLPVWVSAPLVFGLSLLAPAVVSSTPAGAQERQPWAQPEAPARIRPYEDSRRDWEQQQERQEQPPPSYTEPAPRYGAPPPAASYDRPAYAGREDYRPLRRDDAYRPPAAPSEPPAYGAPYSPPYGAAPTDGAYRDRAYEPPPRRADDYDRPRDGTFTMREILDTGHGFFGSISQGLASVLEYTFKTQGRPNGYILGEDIGGAFVAGLRYGEGRLHTRDAGTHRVYWQGPSLGYDAGAEGSKVMVLVYNMRDPEDIYQRFGGVAGSAYVVGGVGLTFQRRDDIVLAPIRAGVGFRLGANVGYLKYTRRPTWNPF